MKRMILLALLALVAGCASTQNAYVQAQKDALVRESDARVAEAQAIAAVAPKLDSGGAAAYAIMVAMRGAQSGAYQAKVDRPRDWLDYAQGVANIVGVIGQVAVPIASVRASRDVAIAGYNRDVAISQSQQLGESARMATVANIATSIGTAPRPPTTQINVTAGGDSVVGSGSINRSDNRNCSTQGGSGTAPGGVLMSIGGILIPGGPGGEAFGGC